MLFSASDLGTDRDSTFSVRSLELQHPRSLVQIGGSQSPKSNSLIFEVDLFWQAPRRRHSLAAFGV